MIKLAIVILTGVVLVCTLILLSAPDAQACSPGTTVGCGTPAPSWAAPTPTQQDTPFPYPGPVSTPVPTPAPTLQPYPPPEGGSYPTAVSSVSAEDYPNRWWRLFGLTAVQWEKLSPLQRRVLFMILGE